MLWLRALPVWVVPLAVGVFQVVASSGASRRFHDDAVPLDGWGYALLIVAAAALLLRRRRPVMTLAVVGVATLAFALRGYAIGPSFLSLVVALVSAVQKGHRRAAWVTGASVLTGYSLVAFWIGGPLVNVDEPTVNDALPALAWTLLVLSAAEVVRFRSEKAAQVQRTLREEARRRASEERLLIARELHDVLAHNISMINVQAGVALHLMDEHPEQVRTALVAIKEASKEALTEMRSVLGVLRQDGDSAPRTPTAGLAMLGDLLAQARSTGLDIRLETIGAERPLPAGTDLAAFRIVQESMTNVSRHSGAGRVRIKIVYGSGHVDLDIEDDGSGPGDGSGGSGISGMRERAVALGGEFAAGPGPGGGFRVSAHLPIEGD